MRLAPAPDHPQVQGRLPRQRGQPAAARKSVDDYREHQDTAGTTEIGFGSFRISLPAPTNDGDTLGHTYEEWGLTPGSRLFAALGVLAIVLLVLGIARLL